MRIDLKTKKPVIANKMGGFSGSAIFPVAVRMVYQVANAVNIPIVGMGGVTTAEDVVELMLAGATAVEVGAANLVDPYVCRDIINDLPYVMEKDGLNIGEAIDILNKQSGLIGMSEKSSDMRDIINGMNEGDEKCLLAFNKYCRSVTNYIAQYYVLLEGADIIVFTAGVGENSVPVRREICEKLSTIGVKINLDENQKRSEFVKLSTEGSSVLVYVIPTNEELVIARDSYELVRNGI